MSIATVTAARIYKGQKAGRTGEEEELTFDKFPYTALSRVALSCDSSHYQRNNRIILKRVF